MDELSLVKFYVGSYWTVVLNSRPLYPVVSTLLKIVESLVFSEDSSEDGNKDVERISWLYKYTHKEVMKPVSIVEFAVYKNVGHNLGREIDLDSDSFSILSLYKYLDDVSRELSLIVTKIAKKYNLDIPLNIHSSQKVVIN